MRSRTTAFLLAFSLVVLSPTPALAASSVSSGRYFMTTTRSFWRNAMSARHVFPDGFTADLSDLQLRIAKLAGLKPIAVKKFYILADPLESASPTPQTTPSKNISWGLGVLLGDTELRSTRGGEGVHIALIDTGIDRTHPDLSSRVVGCYDFMESTKGFVEEVCDDQNGHGTHMAGILVADGGPDGIGMYGFVPQASISAYRVCGSTGTCLSDDIAVAIQHAVDAGVQIVVLGMGGEAQSSFIHDALAYADEHDVMVVAPAGNDGPYEDSMDWPARDPRVLSVAAIDDTNEPAEFSSRGSVEFAAPGVNSESTFLDGGYAILSGTSMAAPHIAGLAALLWQHDARHPAQATRALLREFSRDLGKPGQDTSTGWGLPILTPR